MQNRMKNKTRQRAAPRSPTEAAVTCRPYMSGRAVRIADGIMRNFSSQGSYVETSGKYRPGTILIVRMLRYPPVMPALKGANQPPTICLAEVKWSLELAEKNGNRNGMGLRFLD